MEFSVQERWSGFPITSPGDLPSQELNPSVKSPALAGRFFSTEPPEKHLYLEFRILLRKILWKRELQSTPVFLPGESQGQRNPVGYSPWDHKESDMTEQLTLYYVGKRIEFKEIKYPPLSISVNSTFVYVLYTLTVHFNKLGKFRCQIYIP